MLVAYNLLFYYQFRCKKNDYIIKILKYVQNVNIIVLIIFTIIELMSNRLNKDR